MAVAGRFALELDGLSAGYVRNIQGGRAVADVVHEAGLTDHFVHKHIGGIHYEDIVVTFGAGMSRAFYDWIAQASSGQPRRRYGAVIIYDASNKELSRLAWTDGLITTIAFPALDAGSKDPCYMTVKIRPAFVRKQSGGGASGSVGSVKAAKIWSASDFRLTIDGLESECKRVSRIEALALGFKTADDVVGQRREYSRVVTQSDPDNLVITLPESAAKGFFAWFEDFVINGNNGEDREKNGMLQSGPFAFKLGHLGIVSMTGPSVAPGAATTKVEVYCESLEFSATGV